MPGSRRNVRRSRVPKPRRRALIPTYIYPTWFSSNPYWDALTADPADVAFTVFNDASGHASASNSDYVHQKGSNDAAGLRTLWYVETSYGAEPAATVDAEVQNGINWYGVDGVFFDEVASAEAEPPRLRANTFNGGTNGAAITAGNSGGASGDAFDSVTGSPTFTTAQAHEGGMSMAVVDPAALTSVNWTSLGGLTGPVFFRTYIYLSALPPTNRLYAIRILDNAGGSCAIIRILSDGRMSPADASNSGLVDASTALPTGQWVRLEVRIVPSTTVGELHWRVFTTPTGTVPDQSGGQTGLVLGASVGQIQTGAVQTPFPTAPFTAYFDGLAVDTEDWLGPIGTGILAYYQARADYVRANSPPGKGVVVLNHGTVPAEPFINIGDVLITFEGDAVSYVAWTPGSWVPNYPESRFAHLVYDSPLEPALSTAKNRHVGNIYITDSTFAGNPWDELASYWATEQDQLNTPPSASLNVGLAEAIGLADVIARSAIGQVRPVAESLPLADALARGPVVEARALAGTLPLADALVRSGTVSARALAGTMGLADGLTSISTYARALTATLAVADALTRTSAQARALATSLPLADAVTRTVALTARALAESLPVADALTNSRGVSRDLADGLLPLADTLARSAGILARPIAESLPLADILTRIVAQDRQLGGGGGLLSLALDSMTDTAGTLLHSHNADTGENWVRHTNGSAAGANAVVTAQGRVRRSAASISGVLYYLGQPPGRDDYTVRSTMYRRTNTTTFTGSAAYVHLTDNDCYVARWNRDATPANSWQIICLQAGVTVATYTGDAQVITIDQPYVMDFVVEPGHQRLYVDGVLRVESFDTTLTDSGRGGLRFADNGGTDGSGTHMDDFEILVANPSGELVSLADSLTMVQGASRDLDAVTLTIADTASRSSAGQARTLSEALPLADSLFAGTAAQAAITAAIGLTDALARSVALSRAVAEPFGLADSLARSGVVAARALAAAVGMADALTRGGAGHPRTLTEALGLTDTLNRGPVSQSRAIANALALAASLASANGKSRTLAATLPLADALARSTMGQQRALSETTVLTTVVTRDGGLAATMTASLPISDSLARQTILARQLAGGVGITDVLARQSMGQQRIIAESLALADVLFRSLGVASSVSAALALSDSLVRGGINRPRTLAEALGVDMVVDPGAIGQTRSITEMLGIAVAVLATTDTFQRPGYTVYVAGTIGLLRPGYTNGWVSPLTVRPGSGVAVGPGTIRR